MNRRLNVNFPSWVISALGARLQQGDEWSDRISALIAEHGVAPTLQMLSPTILSGGSGISVYPNVLLPNGTLSQTISRPSSSNRIFEITSGSILTRGFELTGTATNNWSNSGSTACIGLTSSVSGAYSLTDSCNFYGIGFSYFTGNVVVYALQKRANLTTLDFGNVLFSTPQTTGTQTFSLRCLDLITNVLEYRINNGNWTVIPGLNTSDLASDRLCLAFDNYNETGSNINFTVSITS